MARDGDVAAGFAKVTGERRVVHADDIRGVEPNDIALTPVGPDLATATGHIREQVQTLE